MQYAYYWTYELLQDFRIGVARLYPPHVTARGRFTPRSRITASELIEIGQRAFRRYNPIQVNTSGLESPTDDLLWYGLPPAATLHCVHNDLEEFLDVKDAIEHDHTSPSHRLSGYRPHVTVSFTGIEPRIRAGLPECLALKLNGWCLVTHYIDDSGRQLPDIFFREKLTDSKSCEAATKPTLGET